MKVLSKHGKHRKHWWTRSDRRATVIIATLAFGYFTEVLDIRLSY